MKSDKKVESKIFSFEPDILGSDARGHTTIEDSNPYLVLDAFGVGTIYFTIKDGKFWLNKGKECPDSIFESTYQPYLCWDYDQFVEQEQFREIEEVVTDAKTGKETVSTRKVSDGLRTVNKFPCNTKNIRAKRSEIIRELAANGIDFDREEIYAKTSPRQMLTKKDVEQQLNSGSSYSVHHKVKVITRS